MSTTPALYQTSFPKTRDQMIWEAAVAALQGMNQWGGPQGIEHANTRAVSAITQADALLLEFEKHLPSLEDEPANQED